MKKHLFNFILISLFNVSTSAQDLDSLYGIWQDQGQSDSVRVDAYMNYIWNGYVFNRPDSAILLSDSLHRYNRKNNYPMASAYGYHLQGVASYYLGDYPASLKYCRQMATVYEQLGDKNGIASSLHNIGEIYSELGDYERALENARSALAVYEEIGFKKNIATALGNIGLYQNALGNYSQALENNQKALIIQEEIGDRLGMALSLKNIGLIHNNQKDFARALETQTRALEIFRDLENNNGISTSLINIGISHHKLGNTSLALEYCQKGLDVAEEVGSVTLQKVACNCIYNTYKSLDRGSEALVYLERLNVLTDSLKSEETTKKIKQFEFDKIMLEDSIAKAEEARLLKEAYDEEMRREEKTRNISIGIGIFFILLAAGFYSRWRYVRKSKAKLQAEKDRSENLLLNILPKEIAQELKENGKAAARNFDRVSVLFTDFIGFSEHSANLSATELVNELNHCFEAFDNIIEKFGLEKIKTIGDAFMAAGGLPVNTELDVKNTVLAALEMQHFIMARKVQNERSGKPAFQMRAGIHTGPVVAGIVGVKKFQYDIWGDTVNIASRMESYGTQGQVNISQSTYELLKGDQDFIFENRGLTEVKGKGKIEMYFVRTKTNRVRDDIQK